tara:strand:+ start:1388 stop:1687 length:300 start_codon:yes stop_codon:yes gene_type:complete
MTTEVDTYKELYQSESQKLIRLWKELGFSEEFGIALKIKNVARVIDSSHEHVRKLEHDDGSPITGIWTDEDHGAKRYLITDIFDHLVDRKVKMILGTEE